MMEAMEERGFHVRGVIWGRPLISLEKPAPLMGAVFIGVIDRGTNVVQVRPTTLCPLSCVFCSVDAGPRSRWRQAEFYVGSPSWLAEWVSRVAELKGGQVEALIDGVGDPFAYPKLVELVETLKRSPGVRWVAVETHGWSLNPKLIRMLEKAGLDRINLSIDTLNPEKAVVLSGSPWYDVRRVVRMAEFIVKETNIDLHVTPVWVPGLNDNDIIDVIEWAYRIGAGKRWPPATIQKYERHRYGRKPPGVRELSWREFWERLKEIERRTGLRVTWTIEEWGMKKAPRIPEPLKRGSKVRVEIVSPALFKGFHLAVTLDGMRLVTVRSPPSLSRARPGTRVLVRITRDKDGIYIAEPL
jgi:uncharacterized Fe-S cluster-containing radical SAM superfamily enzyme